jgi:hypothetical protein
MAIPHVMRGAALPGSIWESRRPWRPSKTARADAIAAVKLSMAARKQVKPMPLPHAGISNQPVSRRVPNRMLLVDFRDIRVEQVHAVRLGDAGFVPEGAQAFDLAGIVDLDIFDNGKV